MALLFVAAEAAELKPLAARLSNLRKLKWPLDYCQEGVLEGRRLILAANGAGPRLAAQAVEVALRAFPALGLSSSRLEAVVSTGFCGALVPDLRECEVLSAAAILDKGTGESFPCEEFLTGTAVRSGVVVSQDRIANDRGEKERLAVGGALAVDMESAGVAARTKRAGLPFYSIKVVSDRLDESFGFDLNGMRTPDGRISRGKIILHALTHPNLVPDLFHLKRRSEDAAEALGEFLVSCRIRPESIDNLAS
jgi:nucleoside phosphorylase